MNMIKKPRKEEGDSREEGDSHHVSLVPVQRTTENLDEFKPAVKKELLHACLSILQKRRDDLVDCFFSEHNLVSFFINKFFF